MMHWNMQNGGPSPRNDQLGGTDQEEVPTLPTEVRMGTALPPQTRRNREGGSVVDMPSKVNGRLSCFVCEENRYFKPSYHSQVFPYRLSFTSIHRIPCFKVINL